MLDESFVESIFQNETMGLILEEGLCRYQCPAGSENAGHSERYRKLLIKELEFSDSFAIIMFSG